MSDLDKIKVTTLDKEHYKISRGDFYLITKEFKTLEAKVRELVNGLYEIDEVAHGLGEEDSHLGKMVKRLLEGVKSE